MKMLLVFSLFLATNAFAENIPVKVQCKGPGDFVVRSASKSMGNPYFFSKKTLLEAGPESGPQIYIIQNEDFDFNAKTAHLTGESFSRGYDDAFGLMINFASGQGTFQHGRTKVPLANCRYSPW